MQKTGSLFLLFWLIASGFAIAQDVQVTATVSETNIFTGERFSVNIEISGERFRNVSRPELPDLPQAKLLTPVPSTSSNFTFVNGRATSSYIFTFFYLARQEGTVEIPPATVTVDGKTFQTAALKLTIRSQQQSGTNPDGSAAAAPDIFLKMEVNNTRPMVGEQIIAEVVLYFKNAIDVQSYQPVPGWKAEGFWKEELNDGRQPQASSTIIDGQRFRKATLIRYALFPSKEGKLDLGSYQINCTIRYSSYSRDPFSSFFGGMGGNQKMVELSTEASKITVLPVPDAGPEFSGAVGNFTFGRSIAVKEALIGESIEILTEVQGTGNIALITKPAYNFPAEFEIYEPQEKQSINRRGDEISGTKTFVDVIVPRRPGTFEIPERPISYYDTGSRKLVTRKLAALKLLIRPDPRALSQAGETVSLDLKPWNGLVAWSTRKTALRLADITWFWVLLGFPVLLLSTAYFWRNHLEKLENDPSYARTRSATRSLDKKLEESKRAADRGDIKEAYAQLHLALTGFIADRLKLPPAGLSDADLLGKISKPALSEEKRSQLRRLLEKCATIRFAPVANDADFRADLDLANEMLSLLRRKL